MVNRLYFIALALILALCTGAILTANGAVLGLDWRLETLLLDARTPLLLGIFDLITLLGNLFVVAGISGGAVIFLWLSKTYRLYAVGMASALLGAAASSYFMKELIARIRPTGLLSSAAEVSFSFPSWHATASVALYGFLALLLCRRYPERANTVIAASAVLILAIGFSRLYLGVHFLSDVIAGYALGGLWLLAGAAIAQTLANRAQA